MKPLEDQIAELIAAWREYAVGHTKTMGASASLAAGAFATCATELETLLRDAARAQRQQDAEDEPWKDQQCDALYRLFKRIE